jgi:hypothetical protein
LINANDWSEMFLFYLRSTYSTYSAVGILTAPYCTNNQLGLVFELIVTYFTHDMLLIYRTGDARKCLADFDSPCVKLSLLPGPVLKCAARGTLYVLHVLYVEHCVQQCCLWNTLCYMCIRWLTVCMKKHFERFRNNIQK